MAQVHRFGDMVALSVTGKGATRYLEPGDALTIGRALVKAAREIKAGVRFTESKVGTVHAPDMELGRAAQ